MPPQFTGGNRTLFLLDVRLTTNHSAFYDPDHVVPTGIEDFQGDVLYIPDSGHSKFRAYIRFCTEDVECVATASSSTPSAGSHGTFTGSIGAGFPWAGYRPVAYDARIVFGDLSPADATGDSDALVLPYSLYGLLVTGVENGADVVSLSWGTSECNGEIDDIAEQVDAFAFDFPRIPIIVSGGNCGRRGVTSPATGKNVLSVGATLSSRLFSDGEHGFTSEFVSENPTIFSSTTVASFTSAGPLADGRNAPLLCTDGVNVVGAAECFSPNCATSWIASGTSASAPAVAGAVLVLQQILFQRLGEVPFASTIDATLLVASAQAPVQNVAFFTAASPSDDSEMTSVSLLSAGEYEEPATARSRCWNGALSLQTLYESPQLWSFEEASLVPGETWEACFSLEASATFTAGINWREPGTLPLWPDASPVLATYSFIVEIVGQNATTYKSFDTHPVIQMTNTQSTTQIVRVEFTLVSQQISFDFRFSAVTYGAVASLASCCALQTPSSPPTTYTCSVAYGYGNQTCSGTIPSACVVTGCISGFFQESGACVPETTPSPADECQPNYHWNGTFCICDAYRSCGDGARSTCFPENNTFSTCTDIFGYTTVPTLSGTRKPPLNIPPSNKRGWYSYNHASMMPNGNSFWRSHEYTDMLSHANWNENATNSNWREDATAVVWGIFAMTLLTLLLTAAYYINFASFSHKTLKDWPFVSYATLALGIVYAGIDVACAFSSSAYLGLGWFLALILSAIVTWSAAGAPGIPTTTGPPLKVTKKMKSYALRFGATVFIPNAVFSFLGLVAIITVNSWSGFWIFEALAYMLYVLVSLLSLNLELWCYGVVFIVIVGTLIAAAWNVWGTDDWWLVGVFGLIFIVLLIVVVWYWATNSAYEERRAAKKDAETTETTATTTATKETATTTTKRVE